MHTSLSLYTLQSANSTRHQRWRPAHQTADLTAAQPTKKSLRLMKVKTGHSLTLHHPSNGPSQPAKCTQQPVSADCTPQPDTLRPINRCSRPTCSSRPLKPVHCRLQSNSPAQTHPTPDKTTPTQQQAKSFTNQPQSMIPPLQPANRTISPRPAKRITNSPSPPRAVKKCPGLKCRYYNKMYTHRAALYKHEHRKHPTEVEGCKGNIKCLENTCNFHCRYLDELRKHLATDHSIAMPTEKKNFASSEGIYYTYTCTCVHVVCMLYTVCVCSIFHKHVHVYTCTYMYTLLVCP